jgi:hypothetical protein
MAEAVQLDVLGAGAGGPLYPPTPWSQFSGYLSYGGGLVIGNPPGGTKGAGTINCADYYINGQPFDFGTVLPIAGGTMTGPLILAADPTTALGASTKQYADNGLALKVAKAGDTMTGPLILAADPTAALGASTKQYSDQKVPLAGGTMTGLLVLSADPSANLGAATKQYVDAAKGSAGQGVFLPLAGGTMTGSLLLNANPAVALGATPKQYVDGRTPITVDAPSDGNYYVRYQGAWVIQPTGLPLTDAPQDGSTYGRNNATWTNVYDAGTF